MSNPITEFKKDCYEVLKFLACKQIDDIQVSSEDLKELGLKPERSNACIKYLENEMGLIRVHTLFGRDEDGFIRFRNMRVRESGMDVSERRFDE